MSYWEEIQEILKYAQQNITSTLGMCWGGMAISKYLGIDNIQYKKKVFGVFETKNLDPDNKITGEMDDVFWCPQSRHSGYEDAILERERDKGKINLLAHAEKGGYIIFESPDHHFLIQLGHLEYNADRLIFEYKRDLKAGRTNVDPPENLDLDSPVNRWRGNRIEFFSQWIKYIHETTTYD